MYSCGQRELAIETFIRLDHSHADTMAELGYPTAHALRSRRKEHEGAREVPASRFETSPRTCCQASGEGAASAPTARMRSG